MLAWQQSSQLPAPVRQALEQVHSDLPLVRALEGVLQPARASSDSERLLFSALDAMPGWPGDLRLELRSASPEGPGWIRSATTRPLPSVVCSKQPMAMRPTWASALRLQRATQTCAGQ